MKYLIRQLELLLSNSWKKYYFNDYRNPKVPWFKNGQDSGIQGLGIAVTRCQITLAIVLKLTELLLTTLI